MVSKHVKGYYLRSYEQFQKKSDFNSTFQAKTERKNRFQQGIFEYIKNKNNINKWDISRRKFKKTGTLKPVSKRLKGHYLRCYEQFY